MRRRAVATALLSAWAELATAAGQPSAIAAQSDMARAFGDLPRPGNLADVLSCAGANEALWIAAMKNDPRDPNAHEAKRKAGWYSAVALWVFDVDSTAVIKAVKAASDGEPATVLALARRCRPAPEKWRE